VHEREKPLCHLNRPSSAQRISPLAVERSQILSEIVFDYDGTMYFSILLLESTICHKCFQSKKSNYMEEKKQE
jgi:hypothetical protein